MYYKQKPPTHPLHPVIMNNVCLSCITATAGTGICQDFLSLNTVIIFFNRKSFTTYAFITHDTFLDQAFAHCQNIHYC